MQEHINPQYENIGDSIMKTLFFTILFVSLSIISNSQSLKTKIHDPFTANPQQQGNQLLRKNINTNKLSSVFYRPTIATCNNFGRYSWTWDNKGNCLTYIVAIWLNGAWDSIEKDTYTYDNTGNCIITLYEYGDNSIWINADKYANTYDNSGNQLSSLHTGYQGTWKNVDSTAYTYDNSHNRISKTISDWQFNEWVNDSRDAYTYNVSGNCLTDLYERWINTAWANYSRHSYTNDNSGNCLVDFYEMTSNNGWVNFSRQTNTYDNSSHQLSQTAELWSNTKWANQYRYTYTYDNSGNQLIYLREQGSDTSWVNSSRHTFTYDNYNNRLTDLNEKWANNVWGNNKKLTYTYDSNGNCIHGESFAWINSTWIPVSSTLNVLYNLQSDFVNCDGMTVDLEYSSFTGILDGNTNLRTFNLFQNYPNPFNPSTTINYSLAKPGNVKLTIYNAIGSKEAVIINEYKPAGNYSVKFNGSNLASGIYFYRLESGNFSLTKKLTLMK
jgi:hypothetical protein